MKKRTESHLVTATLKYLQCLENRGDIKYVDRCNSGTIYAKRRKIILHRAGFPDILVMMNKKGNYSQFVFIECKVGTGLSDEQKQFQSMIKDSGHRYIIIKELDDLCQIKFV